MGILDAPPIIAAQRAARTNRAGGNRVVAIGDSTTFNNSGHLLRSLCVRSNQRALFSGWFATQGYTIEQIRDTHLPSVLALTGNQRPAACLILAGTNNVGANSGGGVGTGYNFATSKTSYQQITTALINAGILPVVCTIPPRGDVALANTGARQWNAWLMAFAARSGYPLLDYHSALVSGSGAYLAGMSGDQIHPNGRGFRTMTSATTATLASIFPPGAPYATRSTGDPQNLIPSSAHLFFGTPTNGVALGWSNFSGGSGQVFSVDTTDASIAGNWQLMSKPSAATTNTYLQSNPSITTGFVAGDRLAFSVMFQALNFEAQNDQQVATVSMDFRNSTNTIIGTAAAVASSIGDFTTTSLAYVEGVVPAGTTTVSIGAIITGNAVTTTDNGATLKLAQPSIINLTTLGIS